MILTHYGHVLIDGEHGEVVVRAQWDATRRWNGWLIPSFDVEAVDYLAANLGDDLDGKQIITRCDDAVYLETGDGEEPDQYLPEEDGRWSLGYMSWTWSQSYYTAEWLVDQLIADYGEEEVLDMCDEWRTLHMGLPSSQRMMEAMREAEWPARIADDLVNEVCAAALTLLTARATRRWLMARTR